jgi:hypothetical protein
VGVEVQTAVGEGRAGRRSPPRFPPPPARLWGRDLSSAARARRQWRWERAWLKGEAPGLARPWEDENHFGEGGTPSPDRIVRRSGCPGPGEASPIGRNHPARQPKETFAALFPDQWRNSIGQTEPALIRSCTMATRGPAVLLGRRIQLSKLGRQPLASVAMARHAVEPKDLGALVGGTRS